MKLIQITKLAALLALCTSQAQAQRTHGCIRYQLGPDQKTICSQCYETLGLTDDNQCEQCQAGQTIVNGRCTGRSPQVVPSANNSYKPIVPAASNGSPPAASNSQSGLISSLQKNTKNQAFSFGPIGSSSSSFSSDGNVIASSKATNQSPFSFSNPSQSSSFSSVGNIKKDEPNTDNCLSKNSESTKCLLCRSGYKSNDNGECEKYQRKYIDNCLIYSGTTNSCLKCEPLFTFNDEKYCVSQSEIIIEKLQKEIQSSLPNNQKKQTVNNVEAKNNLTVAVPPSVAPQKKPVSTSGSNSFGQQFDSIPTQSAGFSSSGANLSQNSQTVFNSNGIPLVNPNFSFAQQNSPQSNNNNQVIKPSLPPLNPSSPPSQASLPPSQASLPPSQSSSAVSANNVSQNAKVEEKQAKKTDIVHKYPQFPFCFDFFNGQCWACVPGYVLNLITKKCVEHTPVKGILDTRKKEDNKDMGEQPMSFTPDNNCNIYNDKTQKCTECFRNYYWNEQKSACALSNPLCRTFKHEGGECQTCYQKYTLQKGICKKEGNV